MATYRSSVTASKEFIEDGLEYEAVLEMTNHIIKVWPPNTKIAELVLDVLDPQSINISNITPDQGERLQWLMENNYVSYILYAVFKEIE